MELVMHHISSSPVSRPQHFTTESKMRYSCTSFVAAAAAAAVLLALPAVAVETLPEMRREQSTPSWPGSIAPVTEVDIGAYTGRWFQVRGQCFSGRSPL